MIIWIQSGSHTYFILITPRHDESFQKLPIEKQFYHWPALTKFFWLKLLICPVSAPREFNDPSYKLGVFYSTLQCKNNARVPWVLNTYVPTKLGAETEEIRNTICSTKCNFNFVFIRITCLPDEILPFKKTHYHNVQKNTYKRPTFPGQSTSIFYLIDFMEFQHSCKTEVKFHNLCSRSKQAFKC